METFEYQQQMCSSRCHTVQTRQLEFKNALNMRRGEKLPEWRTETPGYARSRNLYPSPLDDMANWSPVQAEWTAPLYSYQSWICSEMQGR